MKIIKIVLIFLFLSITVYAYENTYDNTNCSSYGSRDEAETDYYSFLQTIMAGEGTLYSSIEYGIEFNETEYQTCEQCRYYVGYYDENTTEYNLELYGFPCAGNMMSQEDFAFLSALAGLLCGFLFALVLILNT